ncbi:MAG: phosphatase PAP2 family protein [Bacteriovorax sp.]|nr:phosphatase PAP2 family protein [Bacteriovorax sp.]
MKKTLVLMLSLFMTTQSFAAPLNLDYGSMIKEVNACKKTIYGCTAEQEIDIARFNGVIMDAYELNNYLSQDTQKSIFIPLALDNSELLTLAAATSLGVIAFKNDQDIMDVIQAHKSSTTAQIATVGNFLGTGTAGMAIAAGSYFVGVYFENNKLKKAGLFMVGASLATSIVTLAAKTTFGRARPNTGEGPYSFFNSGAKSFYSGHTGQAFTIATVISEMYKDDYPIVPYVAYGVAAITAYARMHDQAHWASDVIIGAVAGHLITKLAMNAMNHNSDGRGGVEIYPGFDPSSGSFMIYLEWKEKEKAQPMKCSRMPDGSRKIEACLAEGFAKAAKK